MKKLIAMLLAAVMVLSMAACNPTTNDNTGDNDASGNGVSVDDSVPTGTLEVLKNIWSLYGEDEKFAIMGGNPEGGVMGEPAVYDQAFVQNLTYNLLVPEMHINFVAEASTMIHMMNANSFTSGVVKVEEGKDVKDFCETMRDAIQNNQWMCGFPERLIISSVGGNYVLIAFGVNDLMTPFATHLSAAYPNQNVVYDEAIAG